MATEHDRIAGLAASARRLNEETTTEALLAAACRELAALLDATACAISRVDGELLLEVASFWPERNGSPFSEYSYLLEDYPLTRVVLESRRARAVSLADERAETSELFVLRELGMNAVLMLPLVAGADVWGLVEVYDARVRRFGDVEADLGGLLASHVAARLMDFEHAQAVARLYRETLAALANALEAKDVYTSQHAQEVVALAVDVATRLGLRDEDVRAVELGALLHDVGKIRIPEAILNKPGPLSEAEWDLMRRHPEVGAEILEPIASLHAVLPIVRSSHERWDGTGYPDRLSGEDIPLGARIVAVCDAFRAMIEERPYRGALAREEALRHLSDKADTQFDPNCVDLLLDVLAERERQERKLLLHRPT
jgi:putative nucleotidyltransferase with HDIG domain